MSILLEYYVIPAKAGIQLRLFILDPPVKPEDDTKLGLIRHYESLTTEVV